MCKHCKQIEAVPSIEGVQNISIGNVNADCLNKESIIKLNQEIFLFKENLFYFYIDRYNSNIIESFFKKRASLFLHEKQIKIIGDLQSPTPEERQFIIENKMEEMILTTRGSGKIIVFFPEEYYNCAHIL